MYNFGYDEKFSYWCEPFVLYRKATNIKMFISFFKPPNMIPYRSEFLYFAYTFGLCVISWERYGREVNPRKLCKECTNIVTQNPGILAGTESANLRSFDFGPLGRIFIYYSVKLPTSQCAKAFLNHQIWCRIFCLLSCQFLPD
jgi:hypothetical protein